MTLPCRYTNFWNCELFHKEGDQNVVAPETCRLCMKAKEITKAVEVLSQALHLYGEVNTAVRTMNSYTLRLTKALDRLEAEP